MGTFETEDLLERELKIPKLARDSIGPAGESLSNVACVTHDKGHIPGRGGVGSGESVCFPFLRFLDEEGYEGNCGSAMEIYDEIG
jgi:hypothetical protein